MGSHESDLFYIEHFAGLDDGSEKMPFEISFAKFDDRIFLRYLLSCRCFDFLIDDA